MHSLLCIISRFHLRCLVLFLPILELPVAQKVHESLSKSHSGIIEKLQPNSMPFCMQYSMKLRSSESIIISAKKLFRTSCISDLPMRFWNQFGIVTIFVKSKSRWLNHSASKDAEVFMTRPAHCATSSKIT